MTYYPKASTAPSGTSKGVSASVKFPEIEERILKYWDEDGTFQASVDNRDAGQDGSNEFVFYDGPPFANGLPHYGHLLTGYAKDLVGRYQTQRGKRVERRFGLPQRVLHLGAGLDLRAVLFALAVIHAVVVVDWIICH